jgi:hypothetical protein
MQNTENAGSKAVNIVPDGMSNGPKAFKLGPEAMDIRPEAESNEAWCVPFRP